MVGAPLFFAIGPRKTGDVCSDFARGVVAVERGEQTSLKVGNLQAVRDLLDVEDAVRALWLLTQKGTPGEICNVCSGVGRKVRMVLDLFLEMGSKPISVEHDPLRERPVDEPAVVEDNARLRALGWAPLLTSPWHDVAGALHCSWQWGKRRVEGQSRFGLESPSRRLFDSLRGSRGGRRHR